MMISNLWCQEALVLLLDVGPSMHHLLPEVEKICSMIVQKKVRAHQFLNFSLYACLSIPSVKAENVLAPRQRRKEANESLKFCDSFHY